jgi:hypothetical protein
VNIYKKMKLPKTDDAGKYVGLYVIDFQGQCGIGYTTEEVATLLESEQFAEVKVYKIHSARPDGTMELAGVPREKFLLESGMFFHYRDDNSGRRDFQAICDWSEKQLPPRRAKLHLARSDNLLLIALIYPAEYEQEIGRWLGDSGFRGSGPVDAGVSQVQKYYQAEYQILEKHQLWPMKSIQARDREELLACVGQVWQR